MVRRFNLKDLVRFGMLRRAFGVRFLNPRRSKQPMCRGRRFDEEVAHTTYLFFDSGAYQAT